LQIYFLIVEISAVGQIYYLLKKINGPHLLLNVLFMMDYIVLKPEAKTIYQKSLKLRSIQRIIG